MYSSGCARYCLKVIQLLFESLRILYEIDYSGRVLLLKVQVLGIFPVNIKHIFDELFHADHTV